MSETFKGRLEAKAVQQEEQARWERGEERARTRSFAAACRERASELDAPELVPAVPAKPIRGPNERGWQGSYSRALCEWVGAATPAQVRHVHTDNFDPTDPDVGARDYYAAARPDEDPVWFWTLAAAKAWIEANLPGGKWEAAK